MVVSGSAAELTALQDALLGWYAEQRRDLPWRDCDDPYAVLVSEIMLQQTQVSRVVALFATFMRRFPTVADLAAATPGEVVAAWRGLGYNRRALSLHRAARQVADRHGGVIPSDLAALEALPGVGAYTARAVRAFAFGTDDAPVDVNVSRVLARAMTGAPVKGTAQRDTARAAVPAGRGRDWSAALMDLGATVCTARTPRCGDCPLRPHCAWATAGGDDPATPGRRPTPQTFVGSDRYHRGRLLDALRDAPVHEHAIAAAAATHSPVTAARIAAVLVAEGLAEWDHATLRLPV